MSKYKKKIKITVKRDSEMRTLEDYYCYHWHSIQTYCNAT